MKAKVYLLSMLIVTFSSGTTGTAWAKDIAASSVQPAEAEAAAADKSSDRDALQALREMRDPFKRIGTDVPDVRDDRPRSELESSPVNEFKLVGVLTGPYKTRALIRGPNGTIHTVSIGTRIGVQNGHVKAVLADRIIVTEVVQDVLGEKENITSEIRLSTKANDKGVSSVQGVSPRQDTMKYDDFKSNGAPATPSSSQVVPATLSKSLAPAAATAAAAMVGGVNFNLAVPPPISAPKIGTITGQTSNASQQTAGSK